MSEDGDTRVYWNGHDVTGSVVGVKWVHWIGEKAEAQITVQCDIDAEGKARFGNMTGELMETEDVMGVSGRGILHIEVEDDARDRPGDCDGER